MADEGVSIGNYKGVMLCNRPAGGAGDPVIRGGAGEVKPVPFKAGVPPELVNPRGYDPSLQERLVCALGCVPCAAGVGAGPAGGHGRRA